MGKTPLKKVIKSKLKSNRELTEMEQLREKIKYQKREPEGSLFVVSSFLTINTEELKHSNAADQLPPHHRTTR